MININAKIEYGGESLTSQKRTMYFLMTLLVFAWGLEYVFVKDALTVLDPLTLLFYKYCIGFLTVLVIKLKTEGKSLIHKKDIPLFLLCAIFGEIGYFFFEYSAMDYLPVSLITIILAFVPALSIIVESVLYKKKVTKVLWIGILACAFGVILIIGVDYHLLFEGRIIGYFLAFGAVVAWNLYNFVTASLHTKYESATLTLNQILCTVLLISPYAIANTPAAEQITPSIIGGMLYLGIISSGICFMISVKSIHILGPTPTAMFSNFLPITSTFFGWLFLKEAISVMQIIGGTIVIAAGYIVIKEKGRVEESTHD